MDEWVAIVVVSDGSNEAGMVCCLTSVYGEHTIIFIFGGPLDLPGVASYMLNENLAEDRLALSTGLGCSKEDV